MAFKMKAGKEGPMKKNFGSAMKKPLVGNQKNLPDHIKQEILDAPVKAMKDNAPMMRMDNSAMKAMGKPAPVKAMDKSPMKDDGVKQGLKDLGSTLIGKDTSRERQKQDAEKQAFMANWNKMTQEQKDEVLNIIKKKFGVK